MTTYLLASIYMDMYIIL